MSTLWRQVKPLLCTWEIQSPVDSFLLSLCLALTHWARSSGPQGVVGVEFEVRFFWLMPFQLHHKQGLAPVIQVFVVGASAHTAFWVSGSLIFPPCGVLSLLPALSEFGNFILLYHWVPVASSLLTAHLRTPHFLFGLFPVRATYLVSVSELHSAHQNPYLPSTAQYLPSFQAPVELSNSRPAGLLYPILQQKSFRNYSLFPVFSTIEHLNNV